MNLNLTLPGNIRYQPKDLRGIFGYDNLMQGVTAVEIATLEVLYEIGVLPEADFKILNQAVRGALEGITTSEVDKIEREITKHDIRAWVMRAQEITGPKLGRWLHVPLTSYDALDTSRSLAMAQAYNSVVRPKLLQTVRILAGRVREFANVVQIGRTHGQHALPITVGFWLATILGRLLYNWQEMNRYANGSVGTISGAVGAYNAQVGLGFKERCGEVSFEERVLAKLGLKPAPISTQILPPEPMAYFLFSATMLTAVFGQFGRDCRQLMRSEIGEIAEEFGEKQAGSSTMAHKRNPINFEKLEGMFWRTKNEFGKVFDTLISEHQRDLVGSSVMRDFPIILVNLVVQLDTLLSRPKPTEKNPNPKTFLERITVNREALERNFQMNAKVVLAEPLYIALQMAGYEDDAHHLVNHKLVPMALSEGIPLIEALEKISQEDDSLERAIARIPEEVRALLHHPEQYIGEAESRALAIAKMADEVCALLN